MTAGRVILVSDDIVNFEMPAGRAINLFLLPSIKIIKSLLTVHCKIWQL
jgi:hypothetical protein